MRINRVAADVSENEPDFFLSTSSPLHIVDKEGVSACRKTRYNNTNNERTNEEKKKDLFDNR